MSIFIKNIPSSSQPIITRYENEHNLNLRFKSGAFYYYQAYAKFSYYTLLSPYNVIVDNEEEDLKHLRIQTNILQKFLCWVLHIWILFRTLKKNFEVIFNHPKKISDDPTLLFKFATELSTGFGVTAFFYLCWLQGPSNNLKYLYQSCFKVRKPADKFTFHEKIVLVSFFVMLAGLSLSSNIFVLIADISNGNLDGTLINLNYQREILPFWTFWGKSVVSNRLAELILYSIVTYITCYQQLFIYGALTTLPYLTCWVVEIISKETGQFLKQNPHLPSAQFNDCYISVKILVGDINGVFGALIFALCMNALTYFSSIFLAVLNPGSLFGRLVSFFVFSIMLLFLLIAARGTENFENFGDYIFDNRDRVDYNTNKMMILLSDTLSRPVGLKAYKFLITYGSLILIFSTAFTYFVVLIQFGTPTSNNGNSTVCQPSTNLSF